MNHQRLSTIDQMWSDRLTEREKAAVLKWLNVGYDLIRGYQLRGSLPPGLAESQIAALVEDFTRALQKAVICTQIAYRGLSAGNWRPESIRFLRELIAGSECITFASHDSATISEAIGHSFCRTANTDEARDLSVLLRISPRTARFLAPFRHHSCDELEVVLLKGAKYHRTAVRRLDAERQGQEFWGVDIREL